MRKTGAKRLTLQNFFSIRQCGARLSVNSAGFALRHPKYCELRCAGPGAAYQATELLLVGCAFRGLQWSAIMRETRAKGSPC